MLLENKNILIGVTGSIAIYKALELIRLCVKAGANVRVVMTEAAIKFINPITFEAISQNKVLCEKTENWDKSQNYNHIDIGKWADLFVIAPASANTINKISHGVADNLLTQIAIAYPNIKLIAPAANTNMINNPITKASLKMLQLCNYRIVAPQIKELACKDVGNGALADIADIYDSICREFLTEEYWENRKVIVSGGGTIEKIDDVRYISNFSSGKMASNIAKSLYYKGADVCYVGTNGFEILPKEIHVIKVQNSFELKEYLQESIQVAKKGIITKASIVNDDKIKHIIKKPYLFMVAAVSDYVPEFPQSGKMKKKIVGNNWKMSLKKNIDILNELNKENIYSVGFKAEMSKNDAKLNANEMLENKKLDAVCLNILNNSESFGSDKNKIELIFSDKSYVFEDNKFNLSIKLLDQFKKEFYE